MRPLQSHPRPMSPSPTADGGAHVQAQLSRRATWAAAAASRALQPSAVATLHMGCTARQVRGTQASAARWNALQGWHLRAGCVAHLPPPPSAGTAFNNYNVLVRSSALDRTLVSSQAFLRGTFPPDLLAGNATGLPGGQEVSTALLPCPSAWPDMDDMVCYACARGITCPGPLRGPAR